MTTSATPRAILVSSRPISWINTAFPFAAAYLMTTRHLDIALVAGAVFFMIPYNLLMYGINDVFDYESDLRNPRKGGAQGAVLDRRLHRTTVIAATLSSAPFIAWLLIIGNPASRIVLVVSVFFVIAYSAPPFRWKEVPFLDSVTSSVHFFSPAVYGLVLAGAAWDVPLVLTILAFALWGIATHAFGAVQDIIADRTAGIASIATFMGAGRTTRFALIGYIGAALLMLPSSWPGPLAAVVVLPYIVTIWKYRSMADERCEEATIGWRRFLWLNQIAGFLVTMLLIWTWAVHA
ncbi:prenyltransferase [Acidipropionibacterium acidipropionici]|jgi:4-hydroxybenzoate polyprenyltransferase|uniref:Prenyltransferase n=1 Tax=Acidipropionibacterium acidipropionici TaxID=1748 RepID=A0AAC8YH08_9ACTN|nr:prenyltransferase [Acidipropionibacterium acidipropionici]AMS06531.1 prenyltransferase [Acidipropionibacterium acidipropionici]AOZ47976.1 prenyltransferase [Acidipropionibacterium acidipropionici]AZP38676.1 prenyltransferase [Acidipropionibacterium acidipropionici]QCV95624.1 prenyltransferase [Acidipropionibacterium acidipropionici]